MTRGDSESRSDAAPPSAAITSAIRYAWEEYKLLQDKVDKIGQFRFQVKGWTSAIIAGLAFVGKSATVEWYVYFFCLLPIAAFWLLERNQGTSEGAFLTRILEIERYLKSVPDACAFMTTNALSYSVRRDNNHPNSPGEAILFAKLRLRRRWFGRIFVQHANGWFYVILVLLVFAAAFCTCWLPTAASSPQIVRISSPVEVRITGTQIQSQSQDSYSQLKISKPVMGEIPVTQIETGVHGEPVSLQIPELTRDSIPATLPYGNPTASRPATTGPATLPRGEPK